MTPGMILTAFVAANSAATTDYARAHAEARAKAYKLDIAARRQISKIYQTAAEEAARVTADSLERGLSELTTLRWQVISSKLADAAKSICEGTENTTKDVISKTAGLISEVDTEYIWRAAKTAGATNRISDKGLNRLFASINDRVVASLSTRLWSDGYTFSQRVWGASGLRPDWLNSIKMTIASGIAQGRDPVKIARDIQIYTKDGKVALINRWGNLERGTAEFAKRIPKNIDYRAARLLRSELNASLQDAEVFSGQTNPAGTGEYDWVLSPIHSDVWGCECSSLAAGGPYTADNIPTYPHPNCFCPGPRLRLRDHDEFMSDLTKWGRGGSVDYLDKWETDIYKAA